MIIVILTYPRSGSTLLLEIIDRCSRLECLSEIFRFKSNKSINTGKNKYRPKIYYDRVKTNNTRPREYLNQVFNSDDICFKIMYFQLIFQPRILFWLLKNTDLWILNSRKYTSDALISMIIKKNYTNKLYIILYVAIKTMTYKITHELFMLVFKICNFPFIKTTYENYSKNNNFVKERLSRYLDQSILYNENIKYDINVKKSHFGNREKYIYDHSYIKFLRYILK